MLKRSFLAILVVIVVIFLGVNILWPESKPVNIPVAKNLSDYASTNAQVRLTTDGRINGDDTHRQIRITVGSTQRTIDIIQGYQERVISTKSYANNESAYDVFLRALDLAGFTKDRKTNYKDEHGVCPQGFRYIYELIGVEKEIRLWSSDCKIGTLAGQGSLIQELFAAQITDYDQITSPIEL